MGTYHDTIPSVYILQTAETGGFGDETRYFGTYEQGMGFTLLFNYLIFPT